MDPVRKPWVRFLKDISGGTFTESLVQCDSSDPPDHIDDTVKPLCGLNVTIDMKAARLESFTSSDGKQGKQRLSYETEMVPSGASMEFNFYIDGVKQDSHNIKADYE